MKLALVFALYFAAFSLRAQNPIVFTIKDRVNIRKEPSTTAPVVATVSRFTTLSADEYLGDLNDTISGKAGFWIPVSHQNKPGFVWSDLVARNAVRSQSNPDVVFLLAERGAGDSMTISVLNNGKIIRETGIKIQFAGEAGDKLGAFITKGPAGVPGVQDVLVVSTYGQFCGDFGEDVFLFWDGKEFRHFRTLTGGSDVPAFSIETLSFPTDIDGRKGCVVLRRRSGEYPENNGRPAYSENTEEELPFFKK